MTTMPSSALDDVDRAIIAALATEGRASISRVADQVHVSRATAYARLQRMVDEGVVSGFSVCVSPEGVGLTASAYIGLNIAQDSWREVRDALVTLAGVEHVALCSGEMDVVVLARTENIASLRELILDGIRSIPGVLTTRTSIILDEVSAATARPVVVAGRTQPGS